MKKYSIITNMVLGAILIFSFSTAVKAATPELVLENSGRLTVFNAFEDASIGAPISLNHYNQKWEGMKSFNFDKSTREGRLITADDVRVGVQYEIDQPDKQNVSIKIVCSSDTPFSTGRLMFAQMLVLGKGDIKVLVNGEDISFGAEYDPKKPYAVTRERQEGKETNVEVLFPNTKLTITGKFDVMLQDMRAWKNQTWSLRLCFTPYQGMLTESKLEFKASLSEIK